MVNAVEAVPASASVTVTVMVKAPVCVGLPVIRPLEELILIPDGAPDMA
ncbi:MAG: hypothetical protein OXI59_14015 [Gemmatimonadota bacterium]|nr:hypothetical protein [Gemmatimonadota bacterium]